MAHLNVEIKARCDDPDGVRRALLERNADFRGTDHQVDTYFNCPAGRLKLREGNIENSLIHYDRPDAAGPKEAVVTLYHPRPDPALKDVLTKALGVRVVVSKRREIYFIGNVKFHIDDVEGLGCFVEIEAIDETGRIGAKNLRAQCRQYMKLFGIRPDVLISSSYGDMLLSRSQSGPCRPPS
jgi:adenylate cyclase class 2